MKHYLGVDIGGMTIKAGLVDEDGKILYKDVCETRPERANELVIKDIYLLCERILKENNLTFDDIEGIGMGIPGTVNSGKGVVTYSGNLNFKKVNVIKEFSKYCSRPAYLGNDANCAALGETKFGSGKGKKNSILITLGTGIGTGFILDGKIFEGNRGEGAEGGHICIKMGGEKCTCGERGCWEAYASALGLMRETKKYMEKYPDSLMNELYNKYGEINGKIPFEAYKAGDKAAEKVIKNYVRYIAAGTINLVNIFRPDVIMIGGGVSNAGDYFIEMVEKIVRRHSFGGRNNVVPPVKKAVLGNDAGIIGAACLAMDK